MKDFKPNSEIVINELIKVATLSWPKDYYREISDLEVIKDFYNKSYNNFKAEIENLLNRFHPASWVRIAYSQLELWTESLFAANHEKRDLTKAPDLFIPIGRYGWRYILEISMEKLADYDFEQYDDSRPTDDDISKIFTYLTGLTYCTEISNYIHYFKSHFKDAQITFSTTLYAKFPFKNYDEKNFFNKLMTYLNDTTDFSFVPEFDYRNNEEILSQIDLLLIKHFGFKIGDVEIISDILRIQILPEIGATILIIPTHELVGSLMSKSKLKGETILNLLNFIFFDIRNFNYEKRNFLQRSQSVRMLNFAGCKFELKNNLKTIYDDVAAEWDHIKNSSDHCIISFLLIEEWKINFISRLIFGQRSDLKSLSNKLNNDIAKIEHYFHRNVFEQAVKNLVIKYGFICISIDKINKTKIPCGEIDAVAVDPEKKIIYIIEAKNTAPAKDSRAFGRLISDHYDQKKYHQKFISKILWVKENVEVLSQLFKIDITTDYTIEQYFVTGSPSPIKFLVDEYQVFTYFEFYKFLSERYGKD